MKPRNKTEKQILEWSKLLPGISPKQDRWALKNCSNIEWAYSNRQRISHGCFYLITTYKGWQVLRYFQLKVHYAYRKVKKYYYIECMQHWLKDGKYIFLSLPRMQSYLNDAFINSGLEVRRGYGHCSLLDDPRNLAYDGVYVVKMLDQYKYAWRDIDAFVDNIYPVFRALNTSSYNETLLRNDIALFKKSINNEFAYNKEMVAAIKIANRYHYDISSSLWWDMIENLAYLKKDLHNPKLVCPKDLHKAHDYWLERKMSKVAKMSDKMGKLRQLASEKMELRRLEDEKRKMEEQKEYAKSIAQTYINKRKRFFDIDITDGIIDIQVLKSVEDFYDEGKEMHHCVFANKYFDVNRKPNCLILSAKVNKERVETIEVDIKEKKIIQCQGKHNIPSEYHDRVIELTKNSIEKICSLA